MAVIFAVIAALLLPAALWERIRYQSLHRDIVCINRRLGELSVRTENGYVLLHAADSCAGELAARINVMLGDFYAGRAEYEQSKKDMAQMLTNISHDIRTPLTVLKGNSEMLVCRTDGTALPEGIRTMAVKIDRKADELIATISDYFTISRISSGDMTLRLQTENIAQICRDTILDYYDLLEKQQFEVNIEIGSVPVFAETDCDALRRILKNLIDNAIRHGGDGKYLAVRLRTEGEKKMIEVEDHGRGILQKQQEQIFARNYTTAAKSSGNGLGLTIAKGLARQMGANLQVRSIPDEKTVFSVIFGQSGKS